MKKRWKALIGVSILFILFCIIGYIDQSEKYPQVTCQNYAIHESFELSGFEFEVEDVQNYNFKEFAKTNGITSALANLPLKEQNMQTLIIRVKATNISSETKTMDFSQLILSSKDESNSMELITFMQLYDDYSTALKPVLSPGEFAEVDLPFQEFDTYWGKKGDNILEMVPLQLVFKLYPVKYSVRLNNVW